MTDTSAEMRAFGASDEACGRWPDDTEEHKSLRAAFIAGAAAAAPPVIHRIASVADAVGWQAGVGGMETAGMIVSYLAAHPEDTETFLRDGTGYLIDSKISVEHGSLTFHRKLDGKVTTPQELRAAIEVKRIERDANNQ